MSTSSRPRPSPRHSGIGDAVPSSAQPHFFPAATDFRRWLAANHNISEELLVGFYKKDSGRPSMTWPESVDEALCVGWIDGVRRRIDDESYSVRFTPRKKTSNWSAINTKRMSELIGADRVRAAGLAAFEARTEKKSGVYSYEQRGAAELDEPLEKTFRAQKSAWKQFQAETAWYRKTAIWWIVSAKREETRRKRLLALIEHSAAGRRLPGVKGS